MRTRSFQKVVFFALAALATFIVIGSAAAQNNNGMHWNGFGTTIHGNPPSVTSFGFGGSPGFHGVPASVTSLNFGNSPFRNHQGQFFSQRRHRNRGFDSGFASPFYGDVVAVPYAYPVYVNDTEVDDSMEEEDYRGGPTIFDRRGLGPSQYSRLERRGQDEEDFRAAAPSQPASHAEEANQPRTVLVFKDGRQLEVLNYAIVGSTLYDLSNGLTRKVALAELDLPATVKQNDDRGVDFQLPGGAKIN